MVVAFGFARALFYDAAASWVRQGWGATKIYKEAVRIGVGIRKTDALSIIRDMKGLVGREKLVAAWDTATKLSPTRMMTKVLDNGHRFGIKVLRTEINNLTGTVEVFPGWFYQDEYLTGDDWKANMFEEDETDS